MKKLNLITIMMALLVLSACKDDDNDVENPEPTNEEELITTVTLHFHEEGNMSNHVMASFKDIDGPGGNAATIDTIKLDTNTTYNVTIDLLNESETPTEVITEEVKEEASEHLFCYEAASTNLSVTITDTDGTFPLGIESTWQTTNADASTILLTLKHQPDGEKDGTCAPGETDVEVNFPVVIM